MQRFGADQVYGGGDCNNLADGSGDDDVFAGTVAPLISGVLKSSHSRHRAALIAFGQTGAGKTHTCVAMELRAASALLDSPNVESICISFLEICGDKLADLLMGEDHQECDAIESAPQPDASLVSLSST